MFYNTSIVDALKICMHVYQKGQLKDQLYDTWWMILHLTCKSIRTVNKWFINIISRNHKPLFKFQEALNISNSHLLSQQKRVFSHCCPSCCLPHIQPRFSRLCAACSPQLGVARPVIRGETLLSPVFMWYFLSSPFDWNLGSSLLFTFVHSVIWKDLWSLDPGKKSCPSPPLPQADGYLFHCYTVALTFQLAAGSRFTLTGLSLEVGAEDFKGSPFPSIR